MKQLAYLILALGHTVAGLAMVGGIADGIVDAAVVGHGHDGLTLAAALQLFGGLFWLLMAAIQPRLDRWIDDPSEREDDPLKGVTPGLHF